MPEGWFTEAEYRDALALVMAAAQAARMAADLSAPAQAEPGPAQQGANGVAYRFVPTRNLSEDTLILLSFGSAELADRVERFRATIPYGARRALIDREWTARRAEFRARLAEVQ